ncbi:DUF2892 domain-containing protein [Nocardioides sp.]|uniref:YgaP family membrane protein n=1 Tax=Nocardioides sp. TaxID=35761 RepID=UPI0027326F3A|nr:DUF2892 domain-containing protein [Nocardioides sp.]MDP3894190.1 DUF2892 domain-containing protein [Nocardioides sp.]
MTRNLSNTDRILRTGLGVVLVAFAIPAGVASISGVVLYVLGAVMLGTAALGFCPLYTALGISTCPSPNRTRRGHMGASQSS